eukprot:snap_masked-scaffold_41-processed-gene-0.6-mRNA-1 protein AED:1.00 eAED:1.00 QI:0/0/0/0/1/1/3/0/151
MEYLKQGKQTSRNFNYSAVAYLVRLMSSQSFFLSKDFVVPSPQEKFFRDEFPVCNASLNTLNGHLLNTFGVSSRVLKLAPSVTEFFNTRREVSMLLETEGSAWFRGTMLLNGSRYVFKAFTQFSFPSVENAYFQLELDNVVKDEALNRLLV